MNDCFCRYSVIIAILKREPKEFSRRVAFQLKKKKKKTRTRTTRSTKIKIFFSTICLVQEEHQEVLLLATILKIFSQKTILG